MVREVLAEQFKHLYISAREFVNSWEKEIYELNNLDYLIFVLINDLASELEKKFFFKYEHNDPLFIQGEEIGTLAFNIGDSLQLFLEKNCFGSCSLHCPAKINDRLNRHEQSSRLDVLAGMGGDIQSCQTKEQCLRLDVLNYVVVDSIVDFYNYELGVILDEGDQRLRRLSEKVIDIIVSIVKTKGRECLTNPDETAADRFSMLMENEEATWEDFLPDEDDDLDEEEGEEWKISGSSLNSIIDEFCDDYVTNFGHAAELKIISQFKEFVSDFLEIRSVDDLTIEDFEEFFCVVLVNELIADENPDLARAFRIFQRLAEHLDYVHELNLARSFAQFEAYVRDDINRTFNVARHYQQKHPLIEYLLKSSDADSTLVEGFFEIIELDDAGIVLEDVHLKTRFENVDLGELRAQELAENDILHIHMTMNGVGWKLLHVEMVYPEQAKDYLY